jgi:hypothetical protein
MSNPLLGRTLKVMVDGREVVGTIGTVPGRLASVVPKDVLVVRYELNGEHDWTFLPEELLKIHLESNLAVNA